MIKTISAAILCAVLFGPPAAQRVRQPRDVMDAYRVCQRFQTLLAEDLDFDRAFEATFTQNASRRREIAIYEGEFGDLDLTSVDDATLLNAFKARMEIVYLMLPLASPDSNEEEALFFPPAIKAIFERKPPPTAAEFPAYAQQLQRDATAFRAHLNELAGRYPRVAERVRQFKQDLSQIPKLPASKVEPLTSYSKGHVLGPNEKYYQIGDYAVIREGTQMKIIGIRFFSRLF
ncbi:MAG TPA: hypothetical protein VHS05_07490 [Pyrinomonadaceae bacterium]|jgi:hypothetical protein|nr:hypothetical protein [Pyrinomonadaceae bacterium]